MVGPCLSAKKSGYADDLVVQSARLRFANKKANIWRCRIKVERGEVGIVEATRIKTPGGNELTRKLCVLFTGLVQVQVSPSLA
jgi:hypothetical protein